MKRGDIYWINLDPTQGSEIKKKRPCIIIGATPITKARRTVVVIPLSTSTAVYPPLTIAINSLEKPSVAVCDQIRAVDKSRFLSCAGALSNSELDAVESGLKQVLAL